MPSLTTLKIVIIGYVWPEPNSSAAGRNMLSIIKQCKDAGHCISFLTAATDSDHKADLDELGIDNHTIELNSSSFDNVIASMAPDVVIFDRYMTEEQFSWRVKEACPNALRVLNTEDLHSLRQTRLDAVKTHCDAAKANLNSELAQREIASILRSDITLVISKHELNLLTTHYGIPASQLRYHPLEVGNILEDAPTFEERAHFVHIGNFRHAPNWDAVLQLKQTIWPAIRKQIPQAELHIYGAYPPKKATQLHNKQQGFLVKGWAESAEDVIKQARVLITPIRFGAGIKGKLLDAARCATPSITTWLGTEGILFDEDITNWPGAVCPAVYTEQQDSKEGSAKVVAINDAVSDYVKCAVSLYNEKDEWQQASRKTIPLLSNYAASKLQQTLVDCFIHLSNNIQTHRNGLFLQSLVWHQSLTASKYMSQWIEAKNTNLKALHNDSNHESH